MQSRQLQDTAYRPKDIPLNGRLITSTSPALIGENDFSDLTNFVYTASGIKTMNGMMSLSSSTEHAVRTMISAILSGETVIAYQTYPNTTTPTSTIASCLYIVSYLPSDYANPSSYIRKRILAYNYKSSTAYTTSQVVLYQSAIHRPSSFYLECIHSGTTASSPPNFDSYDYNDKITDGTVVWIKKKGSLEGQLTVAPDNTIVFTNGHTNLIYGGEQHRVGAVINVLNSKGIDVTDQLTNESYDDKYCATLVVETDGKIYLDIGSPLKLRKFNIYIKNPNTVSSTVAVYRYTTTGWTSASTITDGTNGFSQSGTISFAFSGDAEETSELPDTPVYLYNRHLYWYRIRLSPNSGTLPSDIFLYYISCSTVVQTIPNLWDGTIYTPTVFWKQYSDGSLTDHTINVTKRDSIIGYDGTGYKPSPETTVKLDGIDTFYIGSFIRCTGFRFTFALDFKNDKYVNTATNTMSVYYWNGQGWTSVSNLVDGTSNGTSSFAHDGVVYFTSSLDEKTTTLNTDVPMYYYKIKFSAVLNSTPGVYLDYVETIPTTQDLNSYKTCIIWNNRLALANNTTTSNKSNELIISAPSSPYIWSGEQSITLNIGDTQDITRVVTLFSRYGTDITEALVVFKERSIYYISGSTQDDIKVYAVSNSIGTSSPYTVAVCDLGIRITEGINRSVILFANKSGVYLFDNSSIIAISDDILDKFQSSLFEQACEYASGFYDIVNSRYHFLYWTGSAPNFTYYEYIFDLIYKKWTTANRGSYPLIYGGIIYDFYNNPYAVGFTNNYIAKLNTGNQMINSSYNATLTTGIKPLGTTLYTISNIRRVKLTSTTYTNVSANLSIHCIDGNSSYSSTSYALSISPTNNSPIASPVCQTNLTGNFFYYGLSIALNSSGTYTIQPINISILYKPVRIDFT